MAYPIVPAPYGLKPVNLIGGQVFAGSTRYIPIASGYATSLFYGDLLQLGTTTNLGAVIQSAITFSTVSSTTNQAIGVFLGCTYTNPATGQKLFAQYWPAGTVAADAEAIVSDDPDAIYKVVVVANNGTTSSTTQLNLGQPWVGSNVFLVRNAGNTISGNSAFAVCAGSSDVRTATTAPFRIVEIASDSAVAVSQTATTATSTAMTLTAANTAITVGMAVIGSGVPTGTYVTVVSGTAVTLSQATTSTLSTATAFSFVGSPEVLVKINFGYHAYYNAVGI